MKAKNLALSVVLVCLGASAFAQKDPIRIQAMGQTISMIDDGNTALDGDDPVHRPLWVNAWLGEKGDEDEATQATIIIGSNRVSEGRMSYRAKIDSSHRPHGYDLVVVGDWSARIKPKQLKVVRDSIIEYDGKRVGLVEIEVPAKARPEPEDSVSSDLRAEKFGSKIDDIPGRQVLMALTFNDTLYRNGDFSIMRTRAGNRFSELGVTHEVKSRTFEQFDLWGRTVSGRVFNLDCIGSYGDMWLRPQERDAFTQIGDRHGPVYVTQKITDPETGLVRDTTELFEAFYVTIKTPAKPVTIPLSKATVSLDSFQNVIVEIDTSHITDGMLKSNPMYAFGKSGEYELGIGYELTLSPESGKYRVTFPQRELFIFYEGKFYHLRGTKTHVVDGIDVRNSKYADPPLLGAENNE